jgi:hypothetical protein
MKRKILQRLDAIVVAEKNGKRAKRTTTNLAEDHDYLRS